MILDMEQIVNLSDADVVKRANAAVKIELEKNKARDVPIALYDRKTQKIYQQKSDGTKIVFQYLHYNLHNYFSHIDPLSTHVPVHVLQSTPVPAKPFVY